MWQSSALLAHSCAVSHTWRIRLDDQATRTFTRLLHSSREYCRNDCQVQTQQHNKSAKVAISNSFCIIRTDSSINLQCGNQGTSIGLMVNGPSELQQLGHYCSKWGSDIPANKQSCKVGMEIPTLKAIKTGPVCYVVLINCNQ